MPTDDDLRDISDVRDEVESRLYRRIEHTSRLGKMLYGVIAGAITTIISMTWWVAALNNQMNANTRYIDEQKAERLSQRLHDEEQREARMEKQIDYLNKKVFGYEP
jgi:cell division protein FtsL